MKGLLAVLISLSVILLGYLLFNFIRARQTQIAFLPFELGADSIKAYEERIAELERKAQAVRSRITTAPINERIIRERELMILERKIGDLKVAIEQWRQSRSKPGAVDLYRQCIMLYGKASGVCELLLSDTLPAPDFKK